MKRFFKAFKLLGEIDELELKRESLASEVENYEKIRNERFKQLEFELDVEKEKKLNQFEVETEQIKKNIKVLKESEFIHQSLLEKVKVEYEEKIKEINNLNEKLFLIENGFSKFSSENLTTEKYKPLLDANLKKQRDMIKDNMAAKIFQKYLVNDSEKEGEKLQKDNMKFLLRSFNNESENIMNKLKLSNYEASLSKIKKSHSILNKLSERNGIVITDEFLNLILEELDYRYKLNIAREEEKEQLRLIREEERERKAVEKEIEDKEKELKEEKKKAEAKLKNLEKEYEKESKLKKENQELLTEIRKLQDSLVLIEKKQEENKNYNEVGKSGYVYIISNQGAFGENVFKVGMTRRLEPLDRIRELSGASVPFPFEIHSLILTDDAPTLENTLHKELAKHRVNLVNNRKEFFSLPVEDLRKIVVKKAPNCVFNSNCESEQYLETMKIKKLITS